MAAPVVEGRGRSAETRRPVDRRRAADAAPLQNVDGLVLGLACGRFLVELRVGVGLAHAEIVRGLQRSLLDDDHRQPRRTEGFRGHAASGTAADDHHVGLDLPVLIEGGGILHLPAAGQPRLPGIEAHGAASASVGGPA